MATIAIVGTHGGAARAQGKLDARYVATLAGIPLGHGAWVIEIGQKHFTAAASGLATGLARLFTSGRGSGGTLGIVHDGVLLPKSYAVSIIADQKKVDEVRMVMNNTGVKELVVDPPSKKVNDPEFVPLTEVHRKGVIDPMTASLMTVPGKGELLVPPSCQRTLHIFDGRMRYDLVLTYKRMDKVEAEKGYKGPALVCAVLFRPVAGYFREKSAIKYLLNQRDMEIWLAPLAGTRVLVPFRVAVPTPIGAAVLQATQFITVADKPRPKAAANTPKPQ